MALDDDNDENTQLPQQKIVSIYYYFSVGSDIAFEKKCWKIIIHRISFQFTDIFSSIVRRVE